MNGIVFDPSPVGHYWQYIDPLLMRFDLARSLFYLHMQPPGMNLLVGLIVKLFPESYTPVLHLVFLLAGLTIAFGLMRLMQLLGVANWIRTTLTVIFVVSPGCVLFENFASYEYLTLALLVVAAIALFRLVESPSTGRATLFFTVVLALAMFRNQFHLVYLCLLVAALAYFMPKARRAVFLGALPALLIVLALFLKNWILFGAFSSSTWMGMTTGVVTTYQLSPEEAENLIQQGVVSPLAAITPFSELRFYYPYIQMRPKTGIPVLDQEVTSTGHPNFNNPNYLQVHDQYFVNSKAVMLHYPVVYLRSCLIAWFAYFLPASDFHSFDEARGRIEGFDKVFNAAVFGQFRHADSRKDLRSLRASGHTLSLVLYTGAFLMVLIPVLVIWASAQILIRSLRNKMSSAQTITLGFMLCTIFFITAVANFLSSFENNKYRFPLDAFYVAIFGMLLTRVLVRKQIKRT